MNLDDILAGTDTVMTAELIRLFKFAGCEPTICHVCERRIRSGDTFKLVAHKGTDEMCCAKHGKADLTERDKTRAADAVRYAAERQRQGEVQIGGGYSRPSRASTKPGE